MSHFAPRLLLLCSLTACAGRLAADTPYRASMDFEVQGAWRTAPDLLSEFKEDQIWSSRMLPFEELAGGLKLCAEQVKSGRSSGKWADHPRYPTLHTTDIPGDWSGFKAVTLWVYSEVNTGEAITLAAASDSDETAWRDYFLHTFRIEWTGWRHVVVPLSRFEAYERPAGWQKVDALYLFTKIFDRQPNPYTVLHLDDMQLVSEAADVPVPARTPQPAPGTEITHSGDIPEFDPGILNHAYPELRDRAVATAPIQYEPYFKTERALVGYYPRFQPGFVSVDPQGRAYLQYGAYVVEALDEQGTWTYQSVLPLLKRYARDQLGFEALAVTNQGSGNESAIRFDHDGDAYMLYFISDPTSDWRSRTGLLLHSRDGMKTWDVHKLPYYLARFEKVVGHNRDCLRRPPIILLSRYLSPTTNYLLLPEKRPDGTLVLPEMLKIADEAIAPIPHSGEANQALTHAGKVFIVYAQLKVLPGRANEDGVPSYAVTYDIATRQFSEPVLLGFGGINATDGHNWPGLAADSKGILHVVINGHHNPFVYTHSLKPWDIGEWSEPVRVAKGTSYCGLVCDRNDTLYSVSRNSHPGYYFRLSLHRKKAGQPWEEPKHLVLPYKPYYKIWYHKLTLDPSTDRLFLSYHSQSGSLCLFKDEYLAHFYVWPEREKSFMTQKPKEDGQPRIPLGACRGEPRKYEFYSASPTEMTTLVSDDGGDSWRLALTEDFRCRRQ